MEPAGILLCTAIACVAAMLHGAVGFGFNFLCAPLLALFYPALLPAPVILNSILLVSLMFWHNRRYLDMHGLWWAVGGSAAGAFVAGRILADLNPTGFDAVFGSLLLLAVALSLLGWRPDVTRRSSVIAGTASGFMATITSVGGPPMALLYQHKHGGPLRALLSAYFLLLTPIILVALYEAGRLKVAELQLSVVLLPGMLIGYLFSRYANRHLDQRSTRATVLCISALGGVLLLGRALWAA